MLRNLDEETGGRKFFILTTIPAELRPGSTWSG